YRDNSIAWPSSAMGDSPGFMIVIVYCINSKGTEIHPASDSIHVGSIHVHQATFRVDQCGNFCEMPFKHPGRVRVGDHNAGNAPAVEVQEVGEVIHSDLAVEAGIDLDHAGDGFSATLHRFKSGHSGCGRVRAMGGVRNEDNITLRIATAAVICLKHFEA